MRRIPIEYAREGDILGQSLYNSFGGMLLRQGTKLNQRAIDKLKNYGYYSIYIKDKYTEEEVEDLIKPEIMTKIHVLQDELQGIISESINGRKIDHKKLNKNVRDINEVINEIVYETIFSKNILFNLHNISIYDDYTLTHSINMMLLAIVLANDIGLTMDQIKKLAVGCIFHDIGKTFLPIEIINKAGKLTDEEYEIVKSHPEKGYEFLTNYTDLDAVSRNVALNHHERIDGLGYPRSLKGDDIHEFSKIAAICDVFDALTSDRPYRRALPMHDVMEYIVASGGNQFSIDLIRRFSNAINIYSKGTLVLLSDGREGIVYQINNGFNTRPKIKIYGEKGQEVKPYIVDLMGLNNVVIEKTLHIFSFDM